MTVNLTHYSELVFDCDGVVLNSNKVKTTAFYKSAIAYGEDAANALVDYHVANGGISRYAKFQHFLDSIVTPGQKGPELDELLESYATNVFEGLLNCDIAPGLGELRQADPEKKWFIASGGDQAELRKIFSIRGLSDYFDGGIYGSPDDKKTILNRLISTQAVSSSSSLFIGDSKYDYEASSSFGLDFLFISQWSEVKHWEKWVESHAISYTDTILSILYS